MQIFCQMLSFDLATLHGGAPSPLILRDWMLSVSANLSAVVCCVTTLSAPHYK